MAKWRLEAIVNSVVDVQRQREKGNEQPVKQARSLIHTIDAGSDKEECDFDNGTSVTTHTNTSESDPYNDRMRCRAGHRGGMNELQ